MFELFTDIFTYRENPLTRTDARIKLIVALTSLTCVLLADKWAYPLLICLASITALFALRLPLKVIVGRLLLPLGMVAVILVLRLFMTKGTPLFAIEFWLWKLTATQEGLQAGGLIAARVMGGMGILLLLSSTTPAYEIFRTLRWFRIPLLWVEIAMLVYRYIFVLIDLTHDSALAQKLRLGYRDTQTSLRSLGILSGSVLVRALDQAIRTSEAMNLRGYAGTIPVKPMSKVTPKGIFVTIATSTVPLILFLSAGV